MNPTVKTDRKERKMQLKKALAATAAAGAIVVGSGLALAGPASAANQDGVCNAGYGTGEVCYYYTTTSSSRSDFFYNDSYLWDNRFLSAGSGQGAVVANNSWATCNYDTRDAVRFFDGFNYTGASLRLPPWWCYTDLGGWRDRIESHYFTF